MARAKEAGEREERWEMEDAGARGEGVGVGGGGLL